MNAIGPHRGYLSSERKPRYRRFGLDWHTNEEYDILEKLSRTWKLRFCLSLRENAMGYKLVSHHPCTQCRSLAYSLASLNEDRCRSVQIQELSDLIWPSQVLVAVDGNSWHLNPHTCSQIHQRESNQVLPEQTLIKIGGCTSSPRPSGCPAVMGCLVCWHWLLDVVGGIISVHYYLPYYKSATL